MGQSGPGKQNGEQWPTESQRHGCSWARSRHWYRRSSRTRPPRILASARWSTRSRCRSPTASATCRALARCQAFHMGTPVFPEGLPADGVCNKAPCAGNNSCTFKVVATTVTISSCARKCTGHKDTSSCVEWRRTGLTEAGTVGSSGCHGFGVSITYTGAPPLPNRSSCGTATVKDTITFYKANGNIAFELVFSYGCGQCPQAQ